MALAFPHSPSSLCQTANAADGLAEGDPADHLGATAGISAMPLGLSSKWRMALDTLQLKWFVAVHPPKKNIYKS